MRENLSRKSNEYIDKSVAEFNFKLHCTSLYNLLPSNVNKNCPYCYRTSCIDCFQSKQIWSNISDIEDFDIT